MKCLELLLVFGEEVYLLSVFQKGIDLTEVYWQKCVLSKLGIRGHMGQSEGDFLCLSFFDLPPPSSPYSWYLGLIKVEIPNLCFMKYLFSWNVNMFPWKKARWIWIWAVKLNLDYFIAGLLRDFILLMCMWISRLEKHDLLLPSP